MKIKGGHQQKQNKGVLAKTIHEKERLNVLIPLPVFTALSFPGE